MKKVCYLGISLLLVGCASKNAVTFVTSTDVGIDADFTTQNVTVGYSRVEGVHGPVYESGAVPPVFAKIQSDAKVINPKISQFYVTGAAAEIAAGDNISNHAKRELKGTRNTMYFGTTSGVGLKARFTSGAPTSLTLGYKRQEYSHIPIIERENEEDAYGSVIARIEVGTNNSKFVDTGLAVGQLIATGRPAELLAPIARSIVEVETAIAGRSPEVQRLMDNGATEEQATQIAKGTAAEKSLTSTQTDQAMECIKSWQSTGQTPSGFSNRHTSILNQLKGNEAALKRQIKADQVLRAEVIKKCTNT